MRLFECDVIANKRHFRKSKKDILSDILFVIRVYATLSPSVNPVQHDILKTGS